MQQMERKHAQPPASSTYYLYSPPSSPTHQPAMSSSLSASDIQSWIEGASAETASPGLPNATSRRRRATSPIDRPSQAKRPRRQLGALGPNALNMVPPARGRGRGRGRGRAKGWVLYEDEGDFIDVEQEEDDERTPRPTTLRSTRQSAPNASPARSPSKRPRTTLELEDAPELRPSDSSSSAQRSPSSPSRVSGRSNSSVGQFKVVDDLSTSDVHLRTLAYKKKEQETLLGKDVVGLVDRLVVYNTRLGFLPVDIHDLVLSVLPEQLKDERNHVVDPYFGESDPNVNVNRLIHELFSIETIVRKGSMMREMAPSEAAWNSAIHSDVLTTAFEQYHDHLEWQDITRARISPVDLVPQHVVKEIIRRETKCVDFAICLSSDDIRSKSESLRGQEAKLEYQSVNQSSYLFLRSRPIAISIETKTEQSLSGKPGGLTQLSVWACAQLNRMQDFLAVAAQVDDDDFDLALPKLPIILVSGLKWELYFVAKSRTEKTYLIGPVELGDTNSILSTYRLLRSLRTLADWALREFTAWWNRIFERCGITSEDQEL